MASVGLVHNYLQYEPQYPRGVSSYYISPVCRLMASIWGNDIVLRYLKEGIFEWPAPFGYSIVHREVTKPGCDWIGVNYYGR